MTTLTVTESPQTYISIRNEGAPIDRLIEYLFSSQALDEGTRTKLNELVKQYTSFSKPTIRQFTIFLHEIIREVIQSAITNTENDETLDTLFEYEDLAKKILAQVVPGQDVEKYLECLSIEKVMIERLRLYQQFYEEQARVLDQYSETAQLQMVNSLRQLKERFVASFINQEKMDQQLKTKLVEIVKKIEHLAKQYEEKRVELCKSNEKYNALQDQIQFDHRVFL